MAYNNFGYGLPPNGYSNYNNQYGFNQYPNNHNAGYGNYQQPPLAYTHTPIYGPPPLMPQQYGPPPSVPYAPLIEGQHHGTPIQGPQYCGPPPQAPLNYGPVPQAPQQYGPPPPPALPVHIPLGNYNMPSARPMNQFGAQSYPQLGSQAMASSQNHAEQPPTASHQQDTVHQIPTRERFRLEPFRSRPLDLEPEPEFESESKTDIVTASISLAETTSTVSSHDQHQGEQPQNGSAAALHKTRGRHDTSHYPECRATVNVNHSMNTDKTGSESFDKDIEFTTWELPLIGPYTDDTITIALANAGPCARATKNYDVKRWHELNGFTHVCARCHALKLPCSHGIPCVRCKESGSVCYIAHCVFGNDCKRLECIAMHSDYMTTVENALSASGRNGSELVKSFFHEAHLWNLDPKNYDGATNISPFALPPAGSAVEPDVTSSDFDMERSRQLARWSPALKDLERFEDMEAQKEKNKRDAPANNEPEIVRDDLEVQASGYLRTVVTLEDLRKFQKHQQTFRAKKAWIEGLIIKVQKYKDAVAIPEDIAKKLPSHHRELTNRHIAAHNQALNNLREVTSEAHQDLSRGSAFLASVMVPEYFTRLLARDGSYKLAVRDLLAVWKEVVEASQTIGAKSAEFHAVSASGMATNCEPVGTQPPNDARIRFTKEDLSKLCESPVSKRKDEEIKVALKRWGLAVPQ